MHVLFVCTGNTCRSPMAEYMALDMIKDYPQLADGFSAGSAGTTALPALPMSEQSAQALRELGVPFSQHGARRITQPLVEEADLILTMTAGHLQQLLHQYPMLAGHAHTLKGYAAGMDGVPGAPGYDIADPYGGTLALYMQSAADIRAALRGVFARLSAHIQDQP